MLLCSYENSSFGLQSTKAAFLMLPDCCIYYGYRILAFLQWLGHQLGW